jgi:hypothetical protein
MPSVHLIARTRVGLVLILLSVVSSTLPGCVTTRIATIPNSCTTPDNDPTTHRVVTSYAWGFVQSQDLTPPCDSTFNHLNGVTVKTSAGQAFLAIITLGIVIKRHVWWCCAPYIPEPGSLGNNPR